MEARAQTIREIMDTSVQYLVPFFQRHYSWKMKQWQQLWDDVRALDEYQDDSIHFMGPLVCSGVKGMPGDTPTFLLIDGQQRISTVSVLLAALRDIAMERGLKDLADEILEDFLVNKRAKEARRFKVFPRDEDRAAFHAILMTDDPEEYQNSGLVQAWEFFMDEISEYAAQQETTKLASLLRTITVRLSLVVIHLDGENPYEIFESLNFKGLPLEESDLIRNYIFMQLPQEEQADFNTSTWVPFENKFKAVGDEPAVIATTFYRNYIMRMGTYSKEKSTFVNFKQQMKDRNLKPPDQIKELSRFLDFELMLCRPQTCSTETVAHALKTVTMLDVTTSHPLLLTLLAKWDDGDISVADMIGCVDDLCSFVLRRSICGDSTRPYARWFPEAIRTMSSSPQDDLRNYWLKRGWPDDETFIKALPSFDLYWRETTKCRLILEELEASFGHKETVDLHKLTIEHVMPQTLGEGKNGKAWKDMLGAEWESTHAQWLHTLGNLTLSGYNEPMGNKPYSDKRRELASSKLSLNSYFSDVEMWNAHNIEVRGQKLAKTVVSIWKRPAGAKYIPPQQTEALDLSTDERNQLRQDYWSGLIGRLTAKKIFSRLPEPSCNGYLRLQVGWKHAKLFAYMVAYHKRIGVYVRCDKSKGDSWQQLRKAKPAIEEALGKQLIWEESTDSKWGYVTARLPGLQPHNRSQWNYQHELLVEKIAQFVHVLSPLLKDSKG